jgi:nucleoside-diphosphate-sugar epimerase
MGLDLTTYAMIVEELSRGWISVSRIVNTRPATPDSSRVFGDGEQSGNFAYVGNVVEGNVLAMDAEGGRRQDVQHRGGAADFLKALLQPLERTRGTELRAARPGDVRYSHADISAAERELDCRPPVSVEEGFLLTLDSFGR